MANADLPPIHGIQDQSAQRAGLTGMPPSTRLLDPMDVFQHDLMSHCRGVEVHRPRRGQHDPELCQHTAQLSGTDTT